MHQHSPFCVPFGSPPCFGLSRVLFRDVSPPVAGLTNGRVAIPFTWTPFTACPLAIVAVATPLVTPEVLVTPLPLLTMLPFMDMLSQLSLWLRACVDPTPLKRVPGPPISFDFRGGRCCVSEIWGR